MNDPEIIALRKVLAQRVRSDDVAQRRRDIDARGRAYKFSRCHGGTGHRQRREIGMDGDAGR